MRTILLIGMLSIADAINPNWMPPENAWIYYLAFCAAIYGDVAVTFLSKPCKCGK